MSYPTRNPHVAPATRKGKPWLTCSVMIVLLILILIFGNMALRTHSKNPLAREQEAKWYQQFDAIKQGTQTELSISSLDLSATEFSKILLSEPECLAKVEKVTVLSSYPVPLLDENVRFLEQLSNLREVSIVSEGNADIFFRPIQGATNVRRVLIDATPISPEGARYLASMPNLKELALRNGNFDRPCLAAFLGHPALETLHIDGTGLTENDFAVLREIPKLRCLTLTGIPISQTGVDRLKKLKKLEQLRIDHRHADDLEIKELQTALPDCEISVTK